MRVLGVVPARLGSTRLPNKPLQLLAGEPLVARVIQRVASFGAVDQLVVATDSPAVAEVAEAAGVRGVLTSADHTTGTERVAEVAGLSEFAGYDLIANVQGDEPFLPAGALAAAIGHVRAGVDIGTAAVPLAPQDAADPARVKVVVDACDRALYFSRATIPFRRADAAVPDYWQHLGVYVYTRAALARWVAAPPAPAEQAEMLEQLRALHYGLSIGVARLAESALPGIDTPDDLRRAEAHWRHFHG
ncbi:MAG: 3-deoxy-manno-octulosonate cytidylyltransferase [Gemmatimonadota bacterium]|nr:3-deoxy-manno-octulosonate cytidylyltransferase [Gemmatimonadota bacterium]